MPVRQRGEAGGGGDDRGQRQSPFTHGAEVADEAGVGFLIQLLGGGARGHQPVEAGNRAAGDGHEQQRQHRGGALGDAEVDHRRDNRGAGDDHRAVQQNQTDEQLQAVDVVAGLQQHPHRQQRGDRRVTEQNQNPHGVGRQAGGAFRQGHRHRGADVDQRVQSHHADHRDQAQADLAAVDQLPDHQGHGDGAPHRHHGAGVVDQQLGDHHPEHRVDHQQHQEDDDHEHAARAPADHFAGERAHRLGPVAHARPDRAAVVHAGEEDGPQHHPEKGGQPAPDHRDGGPDDGRRAGHRGEMVAPEHKAIGGHEVDPVLELVGRGAEIRIKLVNFLRDKAGVDKVAGGHAAEAQNQKQNRAHRSCPCCEIGRVSELPVTPWRVNATLVES